MFNKVQKKERMKVLSPLLILIICLILISVAITIFLSCEWNTQNATLVVITLTLITLIFYTASTYSIASITEKRWERESILKTTYSMEMAIEKGKREGSTPEELDKMKDIVLFRIKNSSTLLVQAKVNCNFEICGEPVDYSDAYNGIDFWSIFPLQTSQGYFDISVLLSKKDKTIQDMIQEHKPANREKQLTMNLELKFKDELKNSRKLPKREHFFDFKRWYWIPKITSKDEWVE